MNKVLALVMRGFGMAAGLFGLVLTYNLWVPLASRVGPMPMRIDLLMYLGPVLFTLGGFLLLVTRLSRRTAAAEEREHAATSRLWHANRV